MTCMYYYDVQNHMPMCSYLFERCWNESVGDAGFLLVLVRCYCLECCKQEIQKEGSLNV